MVGFLNKLWVKLLSHIGRQSASYILCCKKGLPDQGSIAERLFFSADSEEVIRYIRTLRIENLHYKKWIENGSLLCLARVESKNELPRGWLHFGGIRSVSSFNVCIGDNAAWLGPDFIPEEHRGKNT